MINKNILQKKKNLPNYKRKCTKNNKTGEILLTS